MLSMKEDTSADTHKMTITAKPRSPCKDMKQSLRNLYQLELFTIGGGGGGKEGGGRGCGVESITPARSSLIPGLGILFSRQF